MIFKKIFKRIAEVLTKPYFLSLVHNSYEKPNGKAHQVVKSWSQKWYGLNKVGMINRFCSSWFVDFLLQAQFDLQKTSGEETDLELAEIGCHNLKIFCQSTDSNSSVVYLFGFSDNITTLDLYEKLIQKGSIALDIGANLGIHSLVMSAYVGDKGKVISFEPLKPIYERLVQNVKVNKILNVDIKNIGVSSQMGFLKFDPMIDGYNIGKGRISDDGNMEVEVATLDEVLSNYNLPVTMIKIDIEGHELEAIKGAQKVLKQYQPFLICEINHDNYSFDEFKEHIPYPADYYKIPLTYYDQFEIIDLLSDKHCDILVVPDSKKYFFEIS